MALSSLAFLQSQATVIEQEVYQIQYGDIQYPNLVPVDTSAYEWTPSVTYYSTDMTGQAEFLHGDATGFAFAETQRDQHMQLIRMANIGYRYTMDELGVAQMTPNVNLTADKAIAARRAYEEFVDQVALYGNSQFGWHGLINADGAGVKTDPVAESVENAGTRLWTEKTPQEIVYDINTILTGVVTDTQQIEMADTLALPIAAFTHLSSTQLPGTTDTILEFIRRTNVYTASTRQELDIVTIRGLESVASGGRMVAYKRDPMILKLHLPMPFRFLNVRENPNGLDYIVPGIFRLGGLEIRRPMAVRYADGMLAA